MEEFLLGQGHPGVDRKGDDKAVIFQESDEQSPVPQGDRPLRPCPGELIGDA